MKVTVKDVEFYIDENLKANLDTAIKSVKHKWDCVYVIDGPEGVAKSTIGKMISFYLSQGKFSEKNIVFTDTQFMEAVDNAKPGEAILWDEFVLGGLSSDGLTTMQKALVKKFTLIRKKRLFIGLVIPYIFMLKKYFIVSRAKFLIHCYTPDWVKRGYFKFYNYTEKNYLFISGHKFWNYPVKCKYSFHGRFTDYTDMFINEEIYENMKDEATQGIKEEEKVKFEFTKKEADYFIQASLCKIYPSESKERKLLSHRQQRFKELIIKYEERERLSKANMLAKC